MAWVVCAPRDELCGTDGLGMPEALDEVVTHGEPRRRFVRLETGRRSGTGWFAQFGTVADQGIDGLVEFGGERRVGQRDAAVVECGAGQGGHAGAEVDLGRCDPQDEGRVGARAAVALPEGQVEVGFVGRLVVGEAQIVGDAEQAAADPRLGVQPFGYRRRSSAPRATTKVPNPQSVIRQKLNLGSVRASRLSVRMVERAYRDLEAAGYSRTALRILHVILAEAFEE